jgi:hypothetical protein
MSAYNPPNFNLPIFDSQAFIDVNTSEFLEFPTAQGLETFPNGLIGSLTGNATSASTITTQNTNVSAVHYLNFSDSSATGVGTPQKTAGISCIPSSNTITATTFSGAATNLAGGAVGQIAYQTATNTTGFFPNVTANANQVLCSTSAGAFGWRQDYSNIIGINTNNTATRTVDSNDYYKLILFTTVSCVATIPATVANNVYIRFSIRGSGLTLTIRNGTTTSTDTIITITTPAFAGGSVGVTLVYTTTTSFAGWYVVQ